MAKIQIKFWRNTFNHYSFAFLHNLDDFPQSFTHHHLSYIPPSSYEMGSCIIPSFLSSRFPLAFCLSHCDQRLWQWFLWDQQAEWGLFHQLPSVLLGENNPQPVSCHSSWACSSISSGSWRTSREATANSWDGFIIWISFSFFEIELNILQFLNKNKLFQTLNKQSPGFRSQESCIFFFLIWSRTVHTLHIV